MKSFLSLKALTCLVTPAYQIYAELFCCFARKPSLRDETWPQVVHRRFPLNTDFAIIDLEPVQVGEMTLLI